MKALQWFLAKLVFQISVDGKNCSPQFEEQFRLIRADELTWAVEKASIIGKMEESDFVNNNQQKVSWKFVETVEVHPLDGIADGMELYVQTEEPESAASYLEIVKNKARQLSDKLKSRKSIISMAHHKNVALNFVEIQ